MFSELFEWIKKHIEAIILIIIIAFIAPILVIQFVYWIGSIVPKPIKTNFAPNDILAYWGAFLAAIGTILLGVLALWQNHVLKEQADAAQKKLEEIEMNKLKPVFSLSLGMRMGRFSNPRFNLLNKGNGTAYNINLVDAQGLKGDGYSHIPLPTLNIEQLYAQERKEIQCTYKSSSEETKWHLGAIITYSDINNINRQATFHFYWAMDKNLNVILEHKDEEVIEL